MGDSKSTGSHVSVHLLDFFWCTYIWLMWTKRCNFLLLSKPQQAGKCRLQRFSPAIRHKTTTASTCFNTFASVFMNSEVEFTDTIMTGKFNVLSFRYHQKQVSNECMKLRIVVKIKYRLVARSQDGGQGPGAASSISRTSAPASKDLQTWEQHRGAKHQPGGGAPGQRWRILTGEHNSEDCALWLFDFSQQAHVTVTQRIPISAIISNRSKYKHPIIDAVTASTLSNRFDLHNYCQRSWPVITSPHVARLALLSLPPPPPPQTSTELTAVQHWHKWNVEMR